MGALLSLVSEHSFLVTRQASEGGGVQWSAPVFCRGRFLSAGLTAGGRGEGRGARWVELAPAALLVAPGASCQAAPNVNLAHPAASPGWMDLRMCLAVRSDEGLRRALRPYCAFCGLNAQFLLDMNGPRVRALHTSSASSSMAQVGRGARGGAGQGGPGGGRSSEQTSCNYYAEWQVVTGALFPFTSCSGGSYSHGQIFPAGCRHD